ncbi:hypothetical protein IEQ34_015552 [Dendrobium chrysotoxum]|uniref:peptidylprolyl isomerase n=1 Tax=Dendrobium chrysotoxum TaxID=161865 RepID=A0AAV7G0C3_DENCH|nr:hypothetical protein IEQ34_015552 [Dendrobium chrysotoxum]
MGPRCGAYNEAGNHLKSRPWRSCRAGKPPIHVFILVVGREPGATPMTRRVLSKTPYMLLLARWESRYDRGKRVVGTHVTSRDAARANKFEPDPLKRACKFRLGDLSGSLLDTDIALHENASYAKAFFRQGQAYMALNDIDAALKSFRNALELEPNDGGIKRELATTKKKIADRLHQEKKAYAKMFQQKSGKP